MAESSALNRFLGEMGAIFREGVNDIRSTAHQVAFGVPEHPSGVGTPMNPTPQMVTEDLKGIDHIPAKDGSEMEMG